jgi:TolA-binding protein
MKVLLAVLLVAASASAQQTHKAPAPSHNQTRASETLAQSVDMNAVWQAELPNMKSDLAELRSMLNVMGSQEFNLDSRTRDALETNRRMWQVVIGRLAELTQRVDALERSQPHQMPRPHPEQP